MQLCAGACTRRAGDKSKLAIRWVSAQGAEYRWMDWLQMMLSSAKSRRNCCCHTNRRAPTDSRSLGAQGPRGLPSASEEARGNPWKLSTPSHSTPVKVNSAPIWSRIRIGAESRAAAQALCSRLRAAGETVSSGMTEGAGGLRISRPRSNELISPCGYGAGTLIMGAVAPVIMAVLAVPVWIMFFNV